MDVTVSVGELWDGRMDGTGGWLVGGLVRSSVESEWCCVMQAVLCYVCVSVYVYVCVCPSFSLLPFLPCSAHLYGSMALCTATAIDAVWVDRFLLDSND